MKQSSGPPLGFSRLETAFILVLVALAGVLAITQYLDLSRMAKESVDSGVVAAVHKGISDYAMESRNRGRLPVYPPLLDHAATGEVDSQDRFFTHVVKHGLAVSGWAKTGRNQYQAPNQEVFTYDPETGAFVTAVSAPPSPMPGSSPTRTTASAGE